MNSVHQKLIVLSITTLGKHLVASDLTVDADLHEVGYACVV